MYPYICVYLIPYFCVGKLTSTITVSINLFQKKKSFKENKLYNAVVAISISFLKYHQSKSIILRKFAFWYFYDGRGMFLDVEIHIHKKLK